MQNKKRREELRGRAIERLGGKCTSCGFSDFRALQIDHINGDGIKDRARNSGNAYFYNRIAFGDLRKYQLLCANCNIIKKIEKKEFGHRFTNYGTQ